MNNDFSEVWRKAREETDTRIAENREKRKEQAEKWIKAKNDFPALLPTAQKIMEEQAKLEGGWSYGKIVDCWRDNKGFLIIKYSDGTKFGYAYDKDGTLVYWEEQYK